MTHARLAAGQSGQLLFQQLRLLVEIVVRTALLWVPVVALSLRRPERRLGRFGRLLGQPVAGDPVMDQLLFVEAEHAEHRRLLTGDQLPEAAGLRVLAALDPAAPLHDVEKLLDQRRRRQPLVHRAALEAAIIGMDELPDGRLLLEDASHLAVDIEALDHRQGAGAQFVEAIAITDATIELGTVAHLRPGGLQALNGLPGMAVVGVVDRDVQGEVIGIDAQLGQLVGGDQQVQRQLFVAEVETDHLRQELLGALGQGQLDRTLHEVLVVQVLPVVAALAGEQLAVEHHMVLFRQALAEFFQIGLNQCLEARLVPALQQAVEPGAVDQLGRRHTAQEVQRMGLAGKIASGRAGTPTVQIGLVLPADPFGMPAQPIA